MRSQTLKLFAVLCLAAGVAQSETTIGVDENGDEYEVKLVNIGGRKLNGGRRHCIVTRRKRSTAAVLGGYGSGNDNGESYYGNDDETENSSIGVQYESEPSTSPITISADEKSTDEEDHEAQGDENNFDKQKIDIQHIEAQPVEPEPVELQSEPNKPDVTNSNGIFFIQYDTPPKVDPLTHAVFELRPVNPDGSVIEDGNVVGHPIKETSKPNKDDYKKPLSNKINTRRPPTPKPNTLNPHRNPGQIVNRNTNLKRKPNKKQTNTKLQVQNNSVPKRRQTGNINKNRLPVKAQTGIKKTRRNRPTNANNKRKQNQNFNNKTRILGINSNTTSKNKKKPGNKKFNNKLIKEVVTITTTGLADDDRNVNCIFIEKAPIQRRTRTKPRTTTTTTTTTRRPFWRILGRSAEAAPDNGYGKRKHFNLRFFN